jgi:hypothetical protein
MFVVLKRESDLTSKFRSLIVAMVLCSAIVAAGWAAYLAGQDVSLRTATAASRQALPGIDLTSSSRFFFADNNGTSRLLQVQQLQPLDSEPSELRVLAASPRSKAQLAIQLPHINVPGTEITVSAGFEFPAGISVPAFPLHLGLTVND